MNACPGWSRFDRCSGNLSWNELVLQFWLLESMGLPFLWLRLVSPELWSVRNTAALVWRSNPLWELLSNHWAPKEWVWWVWSWARCCLVLWAAWDLPHSSTRGLLPAVSAGTHLAFQCFSLKSFTRTQSPGLNRCRGPSSGLGRAAFTVTPLGGHACPLWGFCPHSGRTSIQHPVGAKVCWRSGWHAHVH